MLRVPAERGVESGLACGGPDYDEDDDIDHWQLVLLGYGDPAERVDPSAADTAQARESSQSPGADLGE